MLRLGELREATAEPRECFPACSLGPQVGKRARDLPKREYGTHDAPHDHQRHDGRWRMGEYRRGTNARGHQQRYEHQGYDYRDGDRVGLGGCGLPLQLGLLDRQRPADRTEHRAREAQSLDREIGE